MTKKRRPRVDHRRCVASDCDRFVQPGKALCPDHLYSTQGRETQRCVYRMAATASRAILDPSEEHPDDRRRRLAAEFSDRIQRGSYRELLDPPLRRVLDQAAEERRLTDEVGAIRLALARILVEETDPAKLATGVARLASAAASVARAQRAITTQLADRLTTEMNRVLTELGL